MISLTSSCKSKSTNYIISKECEFYRPIESRLLSGNENEIRNIKKNNIDACYNCVEIKDLQKCKQTLKSRQKYKKELIKKYE